MNKRVLTIWVCILFFASSVIALEKLVIKVNEIKFCKSVEEMKPIGNGTRFNEDVGMIYCFTKLKSNLETGSVFHIWYYKDKEMAKIQLPVKAKTWSTWSSKEISEGQRGEWRVDVVDPSGKLLANRKFRIYRKPEPEKEYAPKSGQGGRDVIWLPSSQLLIDKMLEMAKLSPEDYVIDLGSGDGIIIRSAAMLGAHGLGIEYNPYLVEYSRKKASEEGLSDKAKFIEADIFKVDFSKADVLTLFLGQSLNLRLRSKILDMKPGTRVVSNTWDMGEWSTDKTIRIDDETCSEYCTAHLWIVPAKVKGRWKLPHGELMLNQKFQMINGNITLDGVTFPVKGKMTGDQIIFTANDMDYTGSVDGSRMLLEIKDGNNTRLTATHSEE